MTDFRTKSFKAHISRFVVNDLKLILKTNNRNCGKQLNHRIPQVQQSQRPLPSKFEFICHLEVQQISKFLQNLFQYQKRQTHQYWVQLLLQTQQSIQFSRITTSSRLVKLQQFFLIIQKQMSAKLTQFYQHFTIFEQFDQVFYCVYYHCHIVIGVVPKITTQVKTV
ncbi:Hypothetical_protein [Hexamita inflata]|uniref:Hypothetical_protein n=1 Tax=Hexamita inflata TaxID=28002 RepID=A0AA86RV09_9EUKA|nr:Hypothetical protein HINF_LOCUS66202 [Hexamita inflata]